MRTRTTTPHPPMRAVAAGLVLAALAACAPAAAPAAPAARPVVVVVAGPTERPLPGLDAAARGSLVRAGFAGSFGPGIVQRIAPYRDLSAPRAAASAAELGRIGGADLSLYVGVRHVDRRVVRESGVRRVVVDLQLHALLVEPRSQAVVWSAVDVPRRFGRVESATVPLGPIETDPGVVRLRDEALRALMDVAVVRIAEEPLRGDVDH